jgi:hypothetical protein
MVALALGDKTNGNRRSRIDTDSLEDREGP